MDAARMLFLRNGYQGTTMEEIAAAARLTKRTLYNNYGDKDALFIEIVADTISYADSFVMALRGELESGSMRARSSRPCANCKRLAFGILRPEVIALRRLLVAEAKSFPDLAADYFRRAPGQVIEALASRFKHLGRHGLLDVPDARRAASQFAYLIIGELLDRSVLVGAIPTQKEIVNSVREGVRTFLARYKTAPRRSRRRPRHLESGLGDRRHASKIAVRWQSTLASIMLLPRAARVYDSDTTNRFRKYGLMDEENANFLWIEFAVFSMHELDPGRVPCRALDTPT
jgi:TetR/AcrR family transcriptional repressor of mexJK operon